MRTTLSLLLLLSTPAFADTLDCDIARDREPLSFSAPITDDEGEAQSQAENSLRLGLDASLSKQSFFLVLDDPEKKRRIAFTSSPQAASPDSALLAMNSSSVRCRKNTETNGSLAPPPSPQLPAYFVCVLDEAKFVKGSAENSQRRLVTVTSPLNRTLPVIAKAEDEVSAFRVNLTLFDPFHGLEISLTDKATGETARFSGPARSMRLSFMMGLTLGDRAETARFLRLGCVWTDTPGAFKQ